MNRTLGEALSGRDNALNFLRLVLASSVIFWHTYPVTGTDPAWPAWILGERAVNGFFAISGYLIAGSRLRLEFWTYMGQRAARILPGFWVVLAVTAFVFAPASTWFTGRSYELSDGASYVVRNAALWLGRPSVGETLADAPFAQSWNASLWTLYFEFGAYIVAGALLAFATVRRHQVAVLLVLLAALSAGIALGVGHGFPRPLDQAVQAFRLGSFFVAGMLVHALRDRIQATSAVGVVVLGSFALAWVLGVESWAGQVPFAALLLWLGAILPIRMGAKNDISYGMYIYAFPVQQMLVAAGISGLLGAEGSALLALVLTVPLAWVSWLCVERPSQRLAKRLLAGRRRGAAAP